ncbi:MAG: [acyl-carrier-protein] S-malonyltransferase [Actinomycetota bacterium]|jgi:[acyl-carrier-protein] S-malonyltransferase|nr:[acyl-carrier-protein] S-malonyltransferase [Actinomycetota bacterium]
MLAPWLALPSASETVARWSDIAALDLAAAGTTWDDETIRDTAVAQPLLTAAALLSARTLLGEQRVDAVCGHSIGELPALAIAGVLTDDDAIALAALRGRAMAAATRLAPTGMAAVLGGDADAVAAAAQLHGLEVATVNVAGQVVLGGPVAALDALAAEPPAGARVRRLDVAGAFHTTAMSAARNEFDGALAALTPAAPHTTVIANRDGAVVNDGRDALNRLGAQLTSAVRFDLCLQTLGGLGVHGVIELAPGGTLTAVAKRALPGVELVALRTPDDLPAARALLHPAGEHLPVGWRAVPSPDNGIVDRLIELGETVAVGTPVAVVSGRSGASTIVAPVPGTLTEWLVTAGDPVRAGQLLAVLS